MTAKDTIFFSIFLIFLLFVLAINIVSNELNKTPKEINHLQFYPDHEYVTETGHTSDCLSFKVYHSKSCRKCREEMSQKNMKSETFHDK